MRIFNILIVVIFIFIFTSCNSYYFDFDRVVHYTIKDISLIENDTISIKNKDIISDVLYNRLSDKINLDVIKKIELASTKKTIVNAVYNNTISELFKNKHCSEIISTMCIPIYRDVLIFYKNEEVIGIAKICFKCKIHDIIGSEINTEDFGQCGDYKKLQKILTSI